MAVEKSTPADFLAVDVIREANPHCLDCTKAKIFGRAAEVIQTTGTRLSHDKIVGYIALCSRQKPFPGPEAEESCMDMLEGRKCHHKELSKLDAFEMANKAAELTE